MTTQPRELTPEEVDAFAKTELGQHLTDLIFTLRQAQRKADALGKLETLARKAGCGGFEITHGIYDQVDNFFILYDEDAKWMGYTLLEAIEKVSK